MKNLSILIPTVPTREKYLNRLLHNLEKQILENNLEEKIEIIVYKDNFQHSVGHKRNNLVKLAKGKYSVFIDDDDQVSNNYCKLINEVIENTDDDQIGYNIEYKRKKWYFRGCIISINNHYRESVIIKGDCVFPTENIFSKGYFYYKGGKKIKPKVRVSIILYLLYKTIIGGFKSFGYTSQKVPIKTEISKKNKWNDKKRFQDIDWINQMVKEDCIKTTHRIEEVMCFYELNEKNSISGSIYQKLSHLKKIEKFNKYNINWVEQPISLTIRYVKED